MSDTKPGRPTRPSERRAAEVAAVATKLERKPARLVIETVEDVVHGAKRRALDERVTLRTYVLRLLAKDGVEAAQQELAASKGPHRP